MHAGLFQPVCFMLLDCHLVDALERSLFGFELGTMQMQWERRLSSRDPGGKHICSHASSNTESKLCLSQNKDSFQFAILLFEMWWKLQNKEISECWNMCSTDRKNISVICNLLRQKTNKHKVRLQRGCIKIRYDWILPICHCKHTFRPPLSTPPLPSSKEKGKARKGKSKGSGHCWAFWGIEITQHGSCRDYSESVPRCVWLIIIIKIQKGSDSTVAISLM